MDDFSAFWTEAEPRLRRALTAAFGALVGRDATCDALAYGYEHWTRVAKMRNPTGYLYAVARTSAIRQVAHRDREHPAGVVFSASAADEDQFTDVDLMRALGRLTLRQRTAVLLVNGYGWTQAETSELLGISESSLRNHLRRGLKSLHRELEVKANV